MIDKRGCIRPKKSQRKNEKSEETLFEEHNLRNTNFTDHTKGKRVNPGQVEDSDQEVGKEFQILDGLYKVFDGKWSQPVGIDHVNRSSVFPTSVLTFRPG